MICCYGNNCDLCAEGGNFVKKLQTLIKYSEMENLLKFITIVLLTAIYSFGYAQSDPNWKNAPNKDESIIGYVEVTTPESKESRGNGELYILLQKAAKDKFPNHPELGIRNAKVSESTREKTDPYYENPYDPRKEAFEYGYYESSHNYGKITIRSYKVYADVVVPKPNPMKNLLMAIDKALRNVREGSRLAIDQVTVPYGTNREEYKDQVVDVLLDRGYKVVAKEYLERLYEEQQQQQSGIYNDRTTVQENNFSAVGYFINVRVTESSVRVQVINVSTGEYEGNATITF